MPASTGRALALALVATLAGCASPQESTPTPTNGTTPPTPTTPTWNGTAGFVVEGLTIVPQEGEWTELYEDDPVVIRYHLRHPGQPPTNVTRFVSFLINGAVVTAAQLTLAPSENRTVEHELASLRGLDRVSAEVRVAQQSAKAEVDVHTWPRTRETVDLGNVTVLVNRWLSDTWTRGTLVNVTLTRAAEPAHVDDHHASILCADEAGDVTPKGDTRPALPEPGTTVTYDLRLPGCEHTLYGIRLTGSDPAVRERRILFVERDWAPAA